MQVDVYVIRLRTRMGRRSMGAGKRTSTRRKPGQQEQDEEKEEEGSRSRTRARDMWRSGNLLNVRSNIRALGGVLP